MIRATTLILFLIAAIGSPTQVAAQAPTPTNLVLEVYYYPGEAPAYLVVSPSNSTPGRAYYGRFKRVPGWKDPAGSLPVNAVDIKVLNQDGSVKAIVSLLRGTLHEQQQEIATYDISERERVRVEELKQFGIEPFDLVLVRVAASTDTPKFISKSRSLELVSIQAVVATLPTFRLVIRNVSSKNIKAMKVETGPLGRPTISAMRLGPDGEPLIVAGGTLELSQRAMTRAVAAPEGYKPVSPDNQVILISTVVFDDLSYDGDPETVAFFRGAQLANKIQIPGIIASFQTALTSQEKGQEVLSSLAHRIELLGTDVDPDALKNLLSEFPTLAGKREQFNQSIAFGMSYVKKDAVEEIRKFAASGANDAAIRTWLQLTRERYERWLSRL